MMKTNASRNQKGFSTVQLVITIAVMAIITGFAVVSITRARNRIRLVNSARQFAAYVERARGDAVRRHTTTTVSVDDENSYSVTMDWDGFGNARTQSFKLESGVVFTTPFSVTFDWRGRAESGEVSFGFRHPNAVPSTISVGVTGSGDVTFDAQFFSDSQVPPTGLIGQGGAVASDPNPPPGGDPHASPSPTPTTSPSPGQGASPTPTANPSPTPTANPSPSATPTAYPTPTPTATAAATPSPAVCTLVANPASLTIFSNGSKTVSVNRNNATGAGTISAASSNGGQIQVTPASKSVNGTAATTFTVTVKKASGSVTFSSSGCTSKTVPVTVQ